MRKTKIICTLGPATDDIEVLKNLAKAGMNVARLNLSHGTHEEQLTRINAVKKVRSELGLPLAILLDTKGPEIRLGLFKNKYVNVFQGQKYTLTTNDILGDENIVSVSYKDLPKHLEKGNRILVDDGMIELIVDNINETDIECIVNNDGKLSNRKSINLPGIHLSMPYMNENDRNDIIFGIKNEIDYIAASFVRCKEDVLEIRKILDEYNNSHIKIISKIENEEGVNNADEILSVSNGLMVARGDMGVEISFEQLPKLQKILIKKCYAAGKPAITATQMLDSMIHNPRPTRAEVTDVANAIYDGTSAIMLSGETAAGEYPVECVKTMAKIAESTENAINYDHRFLKETVKNNSITDALSHAACTMAIDLNAKVIITVTNTGHTARMISKFRPKCPIIAPTVSEKNYNQMALTWGVVPIMNNIAETEELLFRSAIERTVEANLVEKDDIVVVTAGTPGTISGTANVLKVFTI